MKLNFLAVHDELLRMGAASLSPEFCRRQVAYVQSFRCDDGGFRGRGGGSDPYYTDFACRTLWLLGETSSLASAADSVSVLANPPADAIEAFCRLNVLRLAGRALPSPPLRHGLGDGGFARPGSEKLSAYHTFLSWLILAALAEDLPALPAGLADLRFEGGFCETAGEDSPQTSATAAAAAVLLMAGEAPLVTDFLVRMQATDGGFLAHPTAPHGDLLSTYTAFLTLAVCGDEDLVDRRAMAQFLKATALPDGGFRSCLLDLEGDVEYTFYGLATTCLLYAGL